MDLLSGSYSRMEQDMAGLFQVLWGSEDGFASAKTLTGTDDEPLIIPADQEQMVEKICTRPFAADIDHDGDLDLVVGNFGGTFYTFEGEGDGKFNPTPTPLKDKNDKLLRVANHSDPFLFDWDSDGDLDMVSGSSSGGVFLAMNEGDRESYAFAAFQEILPGIKSNYMEPKMGTDHLTQPQGSTRVWIDDVNGDGKFDLLVGDSVTITQPADGVEEDEVEELLDEWQKDYSKISMRFSAIYTRLEELGDEEETEASEESDEESDEEAELSEREKLEAEMEELSKSMNSAYEKREEIVSQDSTGFVWVYYQK